MNDTRFQSELWVRMAREGQSAVVLNALPIGLGIYSAEGESLFMNQTLFNIFGVDPTVPTFSQFNFFDSPDLPESEKQALQRGEEVHTRFPYHFQRIADTAYYDTRDRAVIHVDCHCRPILDTEGKIDCYILIIQEITDQVRREERLKNHERKTEIAIRDADIMVWEFDITTQLFSSENEPLNGYDQSKQLSAEDYIQSAHPEDQQVIREAATRMIQGENFSFLFDARILFPGNPDWQYCTVNGSPFECDDSGHVIRFVGTRKLNTALQKRKLLQYKILNNIPLPIHIKDVEDNFRYVFCNEESKRMFGTSEEKTTYDVMTAEQVARIRKTDMEVFVTGEPYFGLERIELKDGRVYDTIVRKSLIHEDGKRLILNVRWDQSLQNDLERRAKILSLSLEAINAYTWLFEPGKERVSYGEGFEHSGRDITKLDTLDKFVAAIHPEDQSSFTETLQKVLENETGGWDIEYRVDLDNSGVYEWWRLCGLLETTMRDEVPYKYMYGMSINIESHKQAELTLLRNKEELSTLIRQNELVLNNTNAGLAYITTDYVVQWENISVCTASLSYEAYKRGELCYKSAYNRTSPCRNCVMQRAIESRQTEQIKFILDSNHTVEIFATPVFRADDSIDGVVIRVDDITEREQMMSGMEHARKMAEQSDKLKSAFLANMSHEIRTPLNAIVGFSELLMTTTDLEERDEYMRIISNNNNLLLKLINDILDLSKIEAGSVELQYEEFDLSEYFNEMAASMKLRITNPNVRLMAANPHDSCIVSLDKNRIAQIITNYVTNAIKYTPKGFIEMSYEASDDGVRFCVRDTGIGIPEEKKLKVFHRFEKLDEFAQGTGLGLSICKAIASSMGGKVGFESTYNQGSMFWASIPCDPIIGGGSHPKESNDQNNPTQEAPKQGQESTRPGGKVILVAEDIPSNYLLVSALLKDKYTLIHATTGKEAVEMARANHPDLVLMDMKMPEMDGLAATVEIRKSDPGLPIVALTAHAFATDRQAAFAAGCNDYLVKPIDKARLMSVVRKYCSKE